jgi:hypothetical protein
MILLYLLISFPLSVLFAPLWVSSAIFWLL